MAKVYHTTNPKIPVGVQWGYSDGPRSKWHVAGHSHRTLCGKIIGKPATYMNKHLSSINCQTCKDIQREKGAERMYIGETDD